MSRSSYIDTLVPKKGGRQPVYSSSPLPVGSRVGAYIISQVLGQGGFGITYIAKEKLTRREVVIKENFPADFALRDEQTLDVYPKSAADYKELFKWSMESFVKEARTLVGIPSHPNVVQVLTTFEEHHTAYIVMVPIRGKNLENLYPVATGTSPARTMDEKQLLPFLKKLLTALEHLHRHGVIHHDIKPANVMMSDSGEPVIVDFGAARPANGSRATNVRTDGYAPPEVVLAGGKITPVAHHDLYALGATCYQLMSGKYPGYDEDYRMSKDPALTSRYSTQLLKTLDKACDFIPSRRWQSAQEWLRALTAAPGPASPSQDYDPWNPFGKSSTPVKSSTQEYDPRYPFGKPGRHKKSPAPGTVAAPEKKGFLDSTTGWITICVILDVIAALWLGIFGWESSIGQIGFSIILFICIILNMLTFGEWVEERKKKKEQEQALQGRRRSGQKG